MWLPYNCNTYPLQAAGRGAKTTPRPTSATCARMAPMRPCGSSIGRTRRRSLDN